MKDERFARISPFKRAMRRRLLISIMGISALGAVLVGCNPNRPEGAREVSTPLPKLVVEKIEPEKALPGQPFSMEIVVRNPGSEPLLDVVVMLDLPEGLRLLSSDPPSGDGSWRFGELSPGGELRIRLQLEGQVGEFPNTVRVRAARPVSAEASGTVSISPIPGITASLSDSPGVAPRGGRVAYSLLVRGQGYGEAQGVSVKVEIPDGMVLESVDAPVGHTTEGSELLFDPFDLEAGEEVLIRFVLVAEEAGDKVVRALIAYRDFAHRLVIEEGTVVYGD